MKPDGRNQAVDWLNILNNPKFPKAEKEFQAALVDWENEIVQYEADTGKRYDPDSKYSVHYLVMPQGIKQFVTLHADDLDDYASLKGYIVKYLQSAGREAMAMVSGPRMPAAQPGTLALSMPKLKAKAKARMQTRGKEKGRRKEKKGRQRPRQRKRRRQRYR